MKSLSLSAFLLPALIAGCSITINGTPPVVGSGVAATEDREIEAFEFLSVSTSVDVVVSCSGDPSLSVTSDDNLLPLITTTVVDGTLRIESEHNIQPTTESVVRITVPGLSGISVAGSGDVTVEGMKTTDADISVSGAGSVAGDVSADSLDVAVAGSGDVHLTGQTSTVDISIAGSGSVSMVDLPAAAVSVSIAGSGDVEVYATKTLDVSIAGSGDVTYKGDATLTKSVLGSGNISKRE
jgi:Putative auto-transporter adhesin, head GIN domain